MKTTFVCIQPRGSSYPHQKEKECPVCAENSHHKQWEGPELLEKVLLLVLLYVWQYVFL